MGVTETPEKKTETPDQDTIEKGLEQSQKGGLIVFSRRIT